ncbi:unnamed protein product [Pleuronectes platessa]|uniref:Uncharacterized protein n=1 Tax=Pleuronectes platessa TaxID=8262 RepID=A0A9N7W1N1_PLEPL|nr:unnamed protein product [Pleuronectes platessa]
MPQTQLDQVRDAKFYGEASHAPCHTHALQEKEKNGEKERDNNKDDQDPPPQSDATIIHNHDPYPPSGSIISCQHDTGSAKTITISDSRSTIIIQLRPWICKKTIEHRDSGEEVKSVLQNLKPIYN